MIGKSATAGGAGIIQYNEDTTTPANGKLLLGNYGDSQASGQYLTILKGGNVGIGTATPANLLTIVDPNLSWGTAAQIARMDTTKNRAILFNNISPATPSGTQPTWFIGSQFSSNNLDIWTWDNSSNSTRMSITASGNVGIGTTAPSAPLHVKYGAANASPSTPALILDNPAGGTQTGMSFRINNAAYGNIRVDSSGNVVLGGIGGNIYLGYPDIGATTTTLTSNGAVGSFSDKRLKSNIHPIDGEEAIDRIGMLHPVLFNWVNPSLHGNIADSGGFVAQDVARVFPHLVDEVDCFGKDCELVNGKKAYSLSLTPEFNAYLVRAVQQLKADNDNQEAEISELREEVKKLKASIH
jgi:hypothetical protein